MTLKVITNGETFMQSNASKNQCKSTRNRQDKSYMQIQSLNENIKITMILQIHCIDFMDYLYLLVHVNWNRYGMDLYVCMKLLETTQRRYRPNPRFIRYIVIKMLISHVRETHIMAYDQCQLLTQSFFCGALCIIG